MFFFFLFYLFLKFFLGGVVTCNASPFYSITTEEEHLELMLFLWMRALRQDEYGYKAMQLLSWSNNLGTRPWYQHKQDTLMFNLSMHRRSLN